jgi:preprotein translocase subunit Sss1
VVSVEKITDKLKQLDEFLAILKDVRKASRDEFLNDKILMGGAKYLLAGQH